MIVNYRDLFLFACYAGTAFIDTVSITKANVRVLEDGLSLAVVVPTVLMATASPDAKLTETRHQRYSLCLKSLLLTIGLFLLIYNGILIIGYFC